MREKLGLFKIKLGLSLKTITWLLSRWRYALLAVVVALLFFELIYWLFNLGVFSVIMTSPNVTIGEKIAVLGSPVQSIAASSGTYTLVLMIILSFVQGISIASLAYVIRHQKKADPNLVGSSSLISLLAIIGLGCPACGTSLITPIVALFVSGSAVSVSENIMAVVLPFALLVGFYGLYVIGLRTANVRVTAGHLEEQSTVLANVNDLQ